MEREHVHQAPNTWPGISCRDENAVPFMLPGGITCDTVRNQLKEKNTDLFMEYDNCYVYGKADLNDLYLNISLNADNQIYSLKMANKTWKDDRATEDTYVETETETKAEIKAEIEETAVEYLSSYKAPKELEDDLTSGIIDIDGDLYKLPCPVSEFIKNGWEFFLKDNLEKGEEAENIVFKKNKKSFEASIKNFADCDMIPENCAVDSIIIYCQNEGAVSFVLPGKIADNLNKYEVEGKISHPFMKGSTWYSLGNPTNNNLYLFMSFDTGSKMYKLRISNKTCSKDVTIETEPVETKKESQHPYSSAGSGWGFN